MAADPKTTIFNTIGPQGSLLFFEKWEQSVDSGVQFDGLVGTGLVNWNDSAMGRRFQRLVLACGNENKNISLDVVDLLGRSWNIQAWANDGSTSIVVLADIPLAPDEHLELTTANATAAMYASFILQR